MAYNNRFLCAVHKGIMRKEKALGTRLRFQLRHDKLGARHWVKE